MHLDVFPLDLLQPFTLALPVFVKLRKGISDIVYKELRQFLVVLDHIAEELPKVVVHNASKFLFEGEWLEIFPLQAASLECIHSILQLVDLLGFFGHELILFAFHPTHNHDVVRV